MTDDMTDMNIREKNELRALLIDNIATASLVRKNLTKSPGLLKTSTRTVFWYGVVGLASMCIAYVLDTIYDVSQRELNVCILTLSVCLIAIGIAQTIRLCRLHARIESSERDGLNSKINRLETVLQRLDMELDIPHERTWHEIRATVSRKEIELSNQM